jgi:hypothetical protein
MPFRAAKFRRLRTRTAQRERESSPEERIIQMRLTNRIKTSWCNGIHFALAPRHSHSDFAPVLSAARLLITFWEEEDGIGIPNS